MKSFLIVSVPFLDLKTLLVIIRYSREIVSINFSRAETVILAFPIGLMRLGVEEVHQALTSNFIPVLNWLSAQNAPDWQRAIVALLARPLPEVRLKRAILTESQATIEVETHRR
jgi:hypothetical protein